MKEGLGPKAAIVLAIVAVAVAGYVGFRSFGGGGGVGSGDNYTAPATGVDMQQLNANPNTPPGMTGAGGGS